MRKEWTILIVLGLVGWMVTGCRHPAKGITPLPKPAVPEVQTPLPQPPVRPTTPPSKPSQQGQIPPGGKVRPGQVTGTTLPSGGKKKPEEIPLAPPEMFEGMMMDTNYFKPQTVYFDFDSSFVKYSERPKVEVVAKVLKRVPEAKLLIDGHCDERGTEEYNRALGERRALALRAYLVQLGIDPNRIRTRSWGEDRPVDPRHNEEAWAKNRRGEFILLLPPGKKIPPLDELLKTGS